MAANSQQVQSLSTTQSLHRGEESVQLESWPAQPLNQAPSSISLGAEQRTVRPPVAAAPRPMFLQQLDAYLEKELRLLGCPQSGPHELRLQAHREVFEYLIEDFKTYKPLLSAIKTEYELYIAHLQENIARLEPLSAEMEVVREECERRLLTIAQDEKRAEAGVETENRRLVSVIDGLRSKQKDYERQVERLQEEVGRLYQQYRDESDARRLLVTEYNQLKQQQTEGEGEGSEVNGEQEREDPTVLKLKLARARKDLSLANDRITGMLADYSDVVPRTEFERMETSYRAMEVELESVKSDHEALTKEHKILQEVHETVVTERDRASSALSHLRGTATPRPEWSRCETFVEGWAESGRGLSSDQLVDLLLARLSGRSLEEVTALSGFQGQGVGEEVPCYLRWEGPIPNLRFSHSHVDSLVAGFWRHSLATSDLHSLVVDECLWDYLLSLREGDEGKAVEDAYNLQYAVSRLTHEPHIALFSRVLAGDQRMEAVQQWMTCQAALAEACAKQQDSEGIISSERVGGVMRSAFPGKTPAMLAQLVSSAKSCREGGGVNFIKMLSPGESGRPSELALLLLEQQLLETKYFITQLQSSLPDSSELTMSEVESAITNFDPEFPTPLLQSLLTPLYSDDPGMTLPLSLITSHLTACGITRHTQHHSSV